jgi:hypothetical protein
MVTNADRLGLDLSGVRAVLRTCRCQSLAAGNELSEMSWPCRPAAICRPPISLTHPAKHRSGEKHVA